MCTINLRNSCKKVKYKNTPSYSFLKQIYGVYIQPNKSEKQNVNYSWTYMCMRNYMCLSKSDWKT